MVLIRSQIVCDVAGFVGWEATERQLLEILQGEVETIPAEAVFRGMGNGYGTVPL